MKVLILGGTGAMGVHLVELLAKMNTEVFVTTRREIAPSTNVSYIKGNAQDIVFLQELLKNDWDAIIDFMHYSTHEFKQRFGYFLKATKQYVFLSSARVYDNSSLVITEQSTRLLDTSSDEKFLCTDEYSIAKARQEDLLIKSGEKNWTIVRPYITYSENRLQLGVFEKEEWLYRAINGKTIIFSNDMANKTTSLTYGLDVSRAIISLIGENNALGEIFHITTEIGKSITWARVLEIYQNTIESKTGIKPKVLFINEHDFNQYRSGISKYQIIYDRAYNRVFDNSKIKNFVNVNSFVDPADGLKDCLEKFMEKPSFNSINWIHEAKKDKLTSEAISFSDIKGTKQKFKYLYHRLMD